MGVIRGGTYLKEVGSWEEILAPWGLSCLGLFVCLPLLSSFFLFLSYLSSPPFPNTMKWTTWLDTFQLWCSASYGLKSNEARSPWTMSSDSMKQKKFSLLLSDFFCPFVSATDSPNNNIEQLSRVFSIPLLLPQDNSWERVDFVTAEERGPWSVCPIHRFLE